MGEDAWSAPGRRRRRGKPAAPPPWKELSEEEQNARVEATVASVEAKQDLLQHGPTKERLQGT